LIPSELIWRNSVIQRNGETCIYRAFDEHTNQSFKEKTTWTKRPSGQKDAEGGGWMAPFPFKAVCTPFFRTVCWDL
jgi:hypothetical protein